MQLFKTVSIQLLGMKTQGKEVTDTGIYMEGYKII